MTVMELLVVVAIVGILASQAAPSFQDMIDKYRLRGAVDTFHDDIQLARSLAIKNNQTVFINISTGVSWCYGINLNSACVCTTAGNCAVKQVNSTSYTGISVESSSFATDPSFNPVRGIATPAGNVVFQSTQGKQAQVNLSLIGKVGICSPIAASAGYPSC